MSEELGQRVGSVCMFGAVWQRVDMLLAQAVYRDLVVTDTDKKHAQLK